MQSVGFMNNLAYSNICKKVPFILQALLIILSINYYSSYGVDAHVAPIATIFFNLHLLLMSNVPACKAVRKDGNILFLYVYFLQPVYWLFALYLMITTYT